MKLITDKMFLWGFTAGAVIVDAVWSVFYTLKKKGYTVRGRK